jgi:hypothetical protein
MMVVINRNDAKNAGSGGMASHLPAGLHVWRTISEYNFLIAIFYINMIHSCRLEKCSSSSAESLESWTAISKFPHPRGTAFSRDLVSVGVHGVGGTVE